MAQVVLILGLAVPHAALAEAVHISPSGFIYLPCSINGVEGSCLLDTGAAEGWMHRKAATGLPRGFAMQVGLAGGWPSIMRSPRGKDMWGRFVFREVVAPERLVFVNSFSDEKGGLTRHPLHLAWPLEMLSTITFAEKKGKTKVTVQWVPLNATAEESKTLEAGRDSMRQGWTGTFDQLAGYLAKA